MNHDSGYHLLFSNPLLVRELVQGFVSGVWVEDIDFGSIKRVNATQHASTLERREGDIIYELCSFSGKPVYLYLFLEFQSTPDRWMALRLSVYVQLFWQQLIKEKQLTANSKLPPVFPLVLYNGEHPWRCTQSVSQLIDLPIESTLWPYQPEMQYYIVDEQHYIQRSKNTGQEKLARIERHVKKRKNGTIEGQESSPLAP